MFRKTMPSNRIGCDRGRALRMTVAVPLLAMLALHDAGAQELDLAWYTVDGGGTMFSSGAAFELGGTVGQADSGILAGGDFSLSGGFWRPPEFVCVTCAGDMNGDGFVDGDDIDPFVAATFGESGGASQPCADMDGDGDIDADDVILLVARLLGIEPFGPDPACS